MLQNQQLNTSFFRACRRVLAFGLLLAYRTVGTILYRIETLILAIGCLKRWRQRKAAKRRREHAVVRRVKSRRARFAQEDLERGRPQSGGSPDRGMQHKPHGLQRHSSKPRGGGYSDQSVEAEMLPESSGSPDASFASAKSSGGVRAAGGVTPRAGQW